MKHFVFLPILFLAFTTKAQFNYTLTGSPVNTTGWSIGGSAVTSGTDVVLTASTTSQAGYIYYSTPVNLTGCSQFTVSFDFSITNSSQPPADGIAFYYITNPPSGFTVGSGIGLPSNPNGLVLVLDTYDNDGNGNNPLVSLRYLNSTNYVEGSSTGLIGPDVVNQSFITNTSWHTCVLTYNNGAMTVAFDGNPPVISGNYSIAINGYFGFSASTGASWSTHSIKNVSISGVTLTPPVANSPVSFCQNSTATALTATGTNLKWYTTPLGGTALASAPVPSTTTPGTYYWYVSQTIPGCGESNRDTVEVDIIQKPSPPIFNYKSIYCAGETFVPFVAPNTLWYTSATGGSGNPIPPTLNTTFPTTFTYYVSQVVNGCESDRAIITVKVLTSTKANFTYTVKYGCHGDTVVFQNTSVNALYHFWSFGDGTGDTSLSPTHLYPLQGNYVVKLETVNANGCKDSISKTVNLIHLLKAKFKVDSDTICEGGFVTFTNQSTVGASPTFYWDFGDGQKTNTPSPIHTFATPGVYTVRLIAKNFNLVDCMDTAYHVILVDSMPSVQFSMSDSILCEGHKVEFNGIYTHNGSNGIEWSFGDSPNTYYVNPIQHNYDTTGTFTILLHATYRACGNFDFSRNIHINPYPTVDLGPDTTMCPNAAPLVLVNKAVNTNASSVNWFWNTGEQSASIIALHPGIYTLNMNMDGCSTNDSIEIFKACYLDIPNAFTPDNDGNNDFFLPRQLLSKSLNTFKMSIYNRWGELMFQTDKIDGRGWDGKFNDKDQQEGVYVYVISIEFKNGTSEKYQGNLTLLR
jgi:gliding motility-associated-like protein